MKENEDIKEAKNELERISQDEILRRQLLKAKIARMDAIQREKDARDDGKEEKAIEIAKNLLKKNIPIEIIIDATGLTKEEIKKIKNKE